MHRRVLPSGAPTAFLTAALLAGCSLFDLVPRQIVLLEGDSLLDYWNTDRHLRGLDVRNRAISGSLTGNVLARLPGELRGEGADRLVLLVGVNDVRGLLADPASDDSGIVDTLAVRLGRLLRAIDSARVPALLIGLLPVHGGSTGDPRRQNALHRAINARLAQALPASGRIELLDPAPLLRAESGELDPFFTIDGLHLNAAGYDRLAPAIRDWIDR